MWDVIKDVLVNVLLILFPVLIYLVFLREKDTHHHGKIRSTFTITLYISLLLTMSFPAFYSNNFSYDLSIIPIIIAFMYVGILPGILSIVLMLLHTFLFHRVEFFPELGNYVILALILSFLTTRFSKQTTNRKILTISILYLAVSTTRALYFIGEGELEHLYFTIALSIITYITLIAVILLIENMEKQSKMQRELEHVEKMNAISQLAASVAHEIRNPMTTVRGFLQLLNNNHDLNSKDKSFIKISMDELDRAQGIINEFLSFSKPHKKSLELLDLTQVINDSVSIISSYAVIKNINITSIIEPSLLINGYKYELQQVFINLLKNAIEAMDAGQPLEIYATKKDKNAEVTIKDHGCGIPKERLNRLGVPYYSTKEKGTGLGLTVSFEIVRRMQGKIKVKSVVNQGTTFTLAFPIATVPV